MKTNKILSISPALEKLFTANTNLDGVVKQIKDSLPLSNQQVFLKAIEKLVSLGVLFNG